MIKLLPLLIVFVSFISCHKRELPHPLPEFNKAFFSFSNVVISEGDAVILEIQIKLTGKHEKAISIPYYSLDSTALSGFDYKNVSGSLNFSGDDSLQYQSLFIEVMDDDRFEEMEFFKIAFDLDTSQVDFDSNQLLVTIIDDDYEYTDNDYPGYVTKLHQEDQGWELMWKDEFGGNELNEDYWWLPDSGNWYNEELQYYRPQNASVSEGQLTITADEENYNNHDYVSARMNSRNRVYFKYGKIEFRVKLPYGQGLWPALWLQGNELYDLGWPKRGEIDVMELRGHTPNTVSSTIHYADLSGDHQYPTSKKYTLDNGDFSDEYHVISMIWDEYKIKFYVDDVLFNTIFHNNINFYNNQNPFRESFYIIMNVAVGGNFGGDPDASTEWPQTMQVDYVRVYKKA